MAIYLVTYRPLIGKPAGQAAIEEYNLPPFIDGHNLSKDSVSFFIRSI
jgi:hypothetical protein